MSALKKSSNSGMPLSNEKKASYRTRNKGPKDDRKKGMEGKKKEHARALQENEKQYPYRKKGGASSKTTGRLKRAQTRGSL